MRASIASLVTTVAAATFVFSSPATARPTSVRALAAQEARLATIAYRIAEANADACREPEIITGLVLHDLTRYDRATRPAVSRAFSLNGGFGVLGIIPNSAAAEAGLRVDDEIVAVGDLSVEDDTAESRRQSYDRMERFNDLVQAAPKDGRIQLLVRRSGSPLRLSLRAQYGCGGKLALTNSSTLNAWSDGKHIVVTTGMVGLSRSDDEIAFVIAHEMAHNILGHSGKGEERRGLFGFSRIKRGEIEADTYAVNLMAKGGYKPSAGISFLESARRRLWWNISLDHPDIGARIRIVTAAMEGANRSASELGKAASQPKPVAVVSAQNASQPMEETTSFAIASVSNSPLFPAHAGQSAVHSKNCER